MKKIILGLIVSMVPIMLLASCNRDPLPDLSIGGCLGQEENAACQVMSPDNSKETAEYVNTESSGAPLPDTMIDFYYAAQNTSVFTYFHNRQIQKFLTMWVKEEVGDIDKPEWNYDSFSKISIMDHDLTVSRPDEQLYYLPFSDSNGRYGYVIAKYHEEGPAISNWGVRETTPYQYDLKANKKEIAASLMKTDIDLSTAKASRVYLYDRDNKRADQAILFTDSKGGNYICYFGDDSFDIEKWKTGSEL